MWRDLKAKYDTRDPRKAMNRAIRAECPGGPEALDALTDSRSWSDPRGYEAIRAIVEAMEQSVRARYGLPPLEDDRESH